MLLHINGKFPIGKSKSSLLCGWVFQQTVGMHMGTNCAPFLADLFLYSHGVDLIQWLLKKNKRKLARSFNFTFHYIDDVLSLNNSSMPTVCCKTRPPNIANLLSIKNTNMLKISVSENFLVESEWCFTK
jgi:hypothetical protein